MNTLIFFIFLSLIFGLTFVYGRRYPENCGDDEKVGILSKHENDRWASRYTGVMFTTKVGPNTNNFTLKVQYDNTTEIYTYKKRCVGGKTCSYYSIYAMDSAFALSFHSRPQPEFTTTKFETPENIEDANFTFSADNTSCSIHVIFQDCSVASPLVVHSTNSHYLSQGKFDCKSGYDLQGSQNTTCMEDGRWNNVQQQTCIRRPGKYGVWRRGKCSKSCGGGVVIYTRTCTDGLCNKTLSKMERCNEFQCPVHPRVMFGGKKFCKWTKGIESSCNFTIQSNPYADDVKLYTVNKELEEIKLKYLNSTSEGNIQTITITHIQNDQLKSQILELQLSSTSYPNHILTIPFTLNIQPSLHFAQSLDVTVITIAVIASLATLIAVLAAAAVACQWKRKSRNNPNSTGSYNVSEAQAAGIEIRSTNARIKNDASDTDSKYSRKIEV